MTFLPVFTARCACCQQPGVDLCRPCRFALASSRSVRVAAADDHTQQCIIAALEFDGAARRAILGLKFANRRAVAGHLARLVVLRLGLQGHAPGGAAFDVVTWAPTSSRRARQRGYDQAQLLARHIARQLGVPCHRLLWRQHGAAQAGRGRSERLHGPSFRVRPATRPLRVLLVDDVVTTGSTLRSAAAALRQAGVGHVTAVAVAATPDQIVRPTRSAQAADAVAAEPMAAAPSADSLRLVASGGRMILRDDARRAGSAPDLGRAS